MKSTCRSSRPRHLSVCLFLMILLVVFSGCVITKQTADLDEEAEITSIREAIEGYLSAWHRKDAEAMASYYAEDYDWMNPVGLRLHGRDAMIQFQSVSFDRELAEGLERSLDYDIDSIRLVADDVAVVDMGYTHVGSPTRSGKTNGRITSVYAKRNGHWLRVVQRNYILLGTGQ